MSILSDDQIRTLVTQSKLIEKFNDTFLQPASYDMCVGKEYRHQGKQCSFDAINSQLYLQPGDFALLSTHEMLNMPINLIGHNGLMSPWAKKGLGSLFSPQIDPGFEGMLIVPVVNLGNEIVTIKHGQAMFTIEFDEMAAPASRKWIDIPGNKRQDSMDGMPSPKYIKPMTLKEGEFKKKLERLEERSSKIETNVAVGKLALYIVTAILSAILTVILFLARELFRNGGQG